jgi:hypothetical protein
MTEKQKQIYNLYLASTRKVANKPFKIRKNFDGFEEKPEFLYIQRLEKTFEQYPHLMKSAFFEAPYKIYQEEKKFFDLKFFSSSKGLSTCIAYINILDRKSPAEQLEFIKESIKFIYTFCAEKKIQFCDYPHYKSVAQNDCLKHLKEHRISWYLIFDIPGFQSLCSDMGEDQFQLYFGQDKNIGEYLINLSSHPEIRNFIRKGLKLIEKKLANQVRMS